MIGNKIGAIVCGAAICAAAAKDAQGAATDSPDANGTVCTVQSPVSAAKTAVGTTLIDFGRDAFGWAELKCALGECIVRLGEKLSEDGRVDMHPGGTIRSVEVRFAHPGGGYSRIPLKADRRNTTGEGATPAVLLDPKRGVVMPFRYIEIVSAPGQLAKDDVRRMMLHWPMDMSAASFRCSDGSLNRVYDLCKYSILATSFAGLYVDGDRERIPYEADAYINQLGHYAVDGDWRLGRKTYEYLMEHPTWPTEWKQFSIMMAWEDWMWSGDKSSIAKCYDALKSKKLLLELAREDGLLVTGGERRKGCVRPDLGDIVDWPSGERDGFEFRSVNAVVNAFHYRNLREMSDIAAALGKADDARFFAGRAEKVRKSFDAAFYRSEQGVYADGEGTDHASLHANAAALAFGLVPKKRQGAVAAFLKGKGMACSVYFAQFLLEALFKAGEAETAISLMSRGGDRSWIGMMDQGSTITMEAWSLEAKPNQDWNHAWGSAPLNVISRYVLGVKPVTPGCSEVEVSPQVGNLKFVEGRVPTPKGAVVVRVVDGKVECAAPDAIRIRCAMRRPGDGRGDER